MAKTYNSIPTVSTGDVYTATAHNNIVTNVNNYRVPPSVCVRLTSSNASYNSNTDISWSGALWDTDSMFSAGSPTLITLSTAGIYQVNFVGRLTDASLTSNSAYLILGTTPIATDERVVGNGYFCLSATVSVTASQTLKARVLCAGGTDPRTLYGNATEQADDQTRLVATWLGQVS